MESKPKATPNPKPEQPARKPGRPVSKPMPPKIPDTPENVLRAVVTTSLEEIREKR